MLWIATYHSIYIMYDVVEYYTFDFLGNCVFVVFCSSQHAVYSVVFIKSIFEWYDTQLFSQSDMYVTQLYVFMKTHQIPTSSIVCILTQ